VLVTSVDNGSRIDSVCENKQHSDLNKLGARVPRMIEIKLLFLLMIANGAPIIAHKLLGDKLVAPVDGNIVLSDGYPLFGSSKTIRGIVSTVLVTTPTAMLLGWSWDIGILFALSVMAGDLFSSFVKRRMGLPPSSMATGIDQIPESLLPLLLLKEPLGLEWQSIGVIVVAFFVAELLSSKILYKFRIRKRPY